MSVGLLLVGREHFPVPRNRPRDAHPRARPGVAARVKSAPATPAAGTFWSLNAYTRDSGSERSSAHIPAPGVGVGAECTPLGKQ